MSDVREVKKWALRTRMTPEFLADVDVEGTLRATIDAQVRAQGYEPVEGSHEFRVMEPNFLFEEEVEAGLPEDLRLVTMTVRCYQIDTR